MKKPHFFCESCGAEAPRDAKQCPACGRYFSSIRCPSCGFTGEEALFREGCPVCGYGAPAPPAQGRREKPDKPIPAGALPPWVYILSAAALAAVVGGLLFILR
jgi:hypothetical protein